MGDNINTGDIGVFNNNHSAPNETSNIGKVIRKMIKIHTSNSSITRKKSINRPYELEEKIKINEINNTNSFLINKYVDSDYIVVDQAIDCIEEVEPLSKRFLFDFYSQIYFDILREKNIDISNEDSIRQNSNEIYLSVEQRVFETVFSGKQSSTSVECNKIYSSAITAYVFYSCKFLIPVKNEV